MVQQDLAPADLDDQILRDQRHIADVNVLTQFTIGQPECRMPNADNIFLGQRGGSNSLTIDKCSALAAEVDDFVFSATGFPQFHVVPGDAQAGNDEVIVGRPPIRSSGPGRGSTAVGRRSTLSR